MSGDNDMRVQLRGTGLVWFGWLCLDERRDYSGDMRIEGLGVLWRFGRMGLSRWWNTTIEAETAAERNERLDGAAEKLADMVYLGRNLGIGFAKWEDIEMLLGEKGMVRQKLDSRLSDAGVKERMAMVVLRDVGKLEVVSEAMVREAGVVVVFDHEVLTSPRKWEKLNRMVAGNAQLVICVEKGAAIPGWKGQLYKLSAKWDPMIYEL